MPTKSDEPQSEWPEDSDSYVFLGRAVKFVAETVFSGHWNAREFAAQMSRRLAGELRIGRPKPTPEYERASEVQRWLVEVLSTGTVAAFYRESDDRNGWADAPQERFVPIGAHYWQRGKWLSLNFHDYRFDPNYAFGQSLLPAKLPWIFVSAADLAKVLKAPRIGRKAVTGGIGSSPTRRPSLKKFAEQQILATPVGGYLPGWRDLLRLAEDAGYRVTQDKVKEALREARRDLHPELQRQMGKTGRRKMPPPECLEND
jgi:hypothetical protein